MVAKDCHPRVITIFCYLLLGLAHEGAHLFTAWCLGAWRPNVEEPVLNILFKALIGRACEISVASSKRDVGIIQHAGWVASLVLAFLFQYRFSRKKAEGAKARCNSSTFLECAHTAAWITAFEAVCTDLLHIGMVVGCSDRAVYFCGNFGLILINTSSWIDFDHGRTALDMLERMVHITMMRGAQSGGVVAWTSRKSGSASDYKGIRSRVVNGKRTDLSKGIRRRVEKDCTLMGRNSGLRPGIRSFLGHTRFATSSISTFDGAHPHQWTPPRKRRVYRMDLDSVVSSLSPTPEVIEVENYITHNGDFDFYTVNGTTNPLSAVQTWLTGATGAPMPSSVDSAAIAGMLDMLRTAGCFGLSARYALLLNCKNSKMSSPEETVFPSYDEFEELGNEFEFELVRFCQEKETNLKELKISKVRRKQFMLRVLAQLAKGFLGYNSNVITELVANQDSEAGDKAGLMELVTGTIDAFFDNDLFGATRVFMKNAKGSFGLMTTSSLDAHNQLCIASRGQPMCVTFYPKKGILCYGSEQAAAKVGLDTPTPGGGDINGGLMRTSLRFITSDNIVRDARQIEDTCRFDLDDLGGEILLIDWSNSSKSGGSSSGDKGASSLHVTVSQESETSSAVLAKRITKLEDNEFIRQLPSDDADPVRSDIRDIPRILRSIQNSWHEPGLNRFSAWNLVRSIKRRLSDRIEGTIPTHCSSVDILLTGCEVSLWVAEQFAADLRKSFSRLSVQAVSSNKLLAVFGQDLSMPSIGYPLSETVPDLKNTVVIIVSHSGQTFAPLACSSLLKSFTNDIFVVSSEWDTQIGKQLRAMWTDDHGITSHRIFTTEVGVRPAEPCSLSVAATQQILTQIYLHVSIALLSDSKFRRFCGAVVTETDLEILSRCNRDSLRAYEDIVGADCEGITLDSPVEKELRQVGDVWSEHILEYPKAYAITFLYVLGTVTSGYPLITGLAIAFGASDGWGFYISRFFDGLLYFFFVQLVIFAIRFYQGRNIRHRTVGRTVVIGDCPWVAQSADSFLSKLFACSYPIAGLNVLHGNPSDHLVHRHTHRVVRGTLLVCGRPDGRLSALTESEVSVCLSVNQASSIQNMGGTCESITIGHNPSEMGLSAHDIFLGDNRPQFLCERVMDDMDLEEKRKAESPSSHKTTSATSVDTSSSHRSLRIRWGDNDSSGGEGLTRDGPSTGSLDRKGLLGRSRLSLSGRIGKDKRKEQGNEDNRPLSRDTSDIKGMFISLRKMSVEASDADSADDKLIEEMVKEKHGLDDMRRSFNDIDVDRSGFISVDAFVKSYTGARGLTDEQLRQVVVEADVRDDGMLDFHDYVRISKMPAVEILRSLQRVPRDAQGYLNVAPSKEEYFGEVLEKKAASIADRFVMSQSQRFAMELYESRVASLERFVSLCVMFHQMGSRVEGFFRKWSLGILGYRMDRTHSIMRVATTASPVSAADVRERMEAIAQRGRVLNAIRLVSTAWYRIEQSRVRKIKADMRKKTSTTSIEGCTSSSDSAATSDSVTTPSERSLE